MHKLRGDNVFRFVINEPKTRKSYQVDKEAPSIIGLKIGDRFDGSMLGLNGFTLQIRGGSDKEGFPMRPEIPGSSRKKVLLSDAPGFHPTKEGQRKRKYVRGNQVSESIMQVNCKIIEGEGDAALMLGIKPKEGAEKK